MRGPPWIGPDAGFHWPRSDRYYGGVLQELRNIVQDVGQAANLEEALTIIVQRVKTALSLDVCSIYLYDAASNEYVLRASDGLNPASIGKVRLPPSEGLVGLVAQRQ